MNKAFVREPDADGAYCPVCAGEGVAVYGVTLDHHIAPTARPRLGEQAWFCPTPRCMVAYFDLFERTVEASELNAPVYPKDVTAPVCPCFAFFTEQIDDDIADGIPTRIRELLEKSKSPEAACQVRAADGRCCMREVQRLYFRRSSPT